MIDFSQLDKVIHEKARLSIMTLLAGRDDWSFQELKAELGMSDGNLITHMRILTGAGFVEEERDRREPGRARLASSPKPDERLSRTTSTSSKPSFAPQSRSSSLTLPKSFAIQS